MMKRITNMVVLKKGLLDMNVNRILGALTLTFCVTLMSATTSFAQPAPIPYHREVYEMDSGVHDGVAAEWVVVFREVVQARGAPWLRLHFSDYNLGRRSYIAITSLKDGGRQRLDSKSLQQWQNGTAFFNGDAVEIELNVAPGEKSIFVRMEEITVGEYGGQGSVPKSLCGNDDRVASTDPREGRIIPIGCTGWIVSNGAHLTAGHCTGTGMQILEFNVPASLCDGTIVPSDPNDQYPIDASSVVFFDDGPGADNIGNDWAVFDCFPNANTGLLPVQAQAGFFRMSRDDNPSNVRVTGYGTDNTPACDTLTCNCNGSDRNSDNQTEQTNSGSYLGETVEDPSDVIIEYTVDTEGGSSGSPVIILGTTRTLGIHTNAGCNPPSDGNHGTGFENNDLENAIAAFPGANAVYVDQGHPVSIENGTIFRPFDTVTEGVNTVVSGGIVSIVAGSYTQTFTAGADGKAMRLEAPVGTVIIGATKFGPTSKDSR